VIFQCISYLCDRFLIDAIRDFWTFSEISLLNHDMRSLLPIFDRSKDLEKAVLIFGLCFTRLYLMGQHKATGVFCILPPLGAVTQKLSFLISSEMSLLSTPGSCTSILKRPSLSSWEKQVQGVTFVLSSIENTSFLKKNMGPRKFKVNGNKICDINS
jgi:hypothetical protein